MSGYMIAPVNIALCGDVDMLKRLNEIFNSSVFFDVKASAGMGKQLIEQLDTLQSYPHVLLAESRILLRNNNQLLSQLVNCYPGLKIVCLLNDDDNLDTLKRLLAYGCRSFLPEKRLEKLKDVLLKIDWSGYHDYSDNRMVFDKLDHEARAIVFPLTYVHLFTLITAGNNRQEIMLELGKSAQDFDNEMDHLLELLNILGLSLEGLQHGLLSREPDRFHMFFHDRARVKIYHDDILLISSDKDYVHVRTIDNRLSPPYLTTLSALEKKFRGTTLMKVNHSTIVNAKYFRRINADVISINDYEVTLGKKYIDIFKKRMGIE